MTSRPPLAVSQRQPQRSLSGSGLSQRPAAHQRSLSQQYLPQSPVRRSDSLNDPTLDSGDAAAQNRYGTTPRRGGSRLKLELANDGIEHVGFSESPSNPDPLSANRVFTPSRMMPMNETSDLGEMSPHTSKTHTADGDSTPMPMPPRRPRFVVPAARPQPSVAPAPVKKDARPKPFTLEPPSAAPKYSTVQGKKEGSGYADFFPWTGHHPEDNFSEYVIKHGYFDKLPAQPQNELGSAKGTLFPSLKHKSGLHMLSSVFTTVLNSRRQTGQISSASTFKPPPRVTLTDTKRELWLKDLANPAISLRRLSRTIPHGIRGKLLLEQCMNKIVPTDRAVWLAKCVGANEIRAFKRKGVNGTFVMGGEAKWIRDWTVFVEQFVEQVVSAFGEKEWRANVTYAIRLATHLYAEHLLDREHYMDWLVSGVENSAQAKLPMWLLIIQIYLKDLLKFRKQGRRFASAILNHYSMIYNHPDRDILQPLTKQLSSIVASLLTTFPENYIHPQTWPQYKDAIRASFPAEDETRQAIYQSLNSRNERLKNSSLTSQPAVKGKLVRLLDSTLRTPFKTELSMELWNVGDDKALLIKTVLDWSTSLYRPGIAKIFVAARVLRTWAAFNVDITGAILEFMDTDPLQELERKQLIYHLVSELVQSEQFSVPRYMQWLIARGGFHEIAETSPDGPSTTRLLVEVPTLRLNDSMRSLRATILRRACFSVEDEAIDIDAAVKSVKYTLGFSLDQNDPMSQKKPMSVKKLVKRIALSSRALQSTLSSWLFTGYIGSLVPELHADKDGLGVFKVKFDMVRTILEATRDFTMLGNVLKALTVSSNAELLACCADTLNLHLYVFSAIGIAEHLFEALMERLKAVREEQGIGARPLLASLTNLAPRMSGQELIATQLQNELLRTDRSSAVDASSPLSDNMANQLQDDETELNEQIEKLASYTSADPPTMERLFQAITSRLQASWAKAEERQRSYCALLTRLRVFDTNHFDTLMKGWVQHLRKLTRRPSVSQMFPLLVSSGCLSLATLFATATRSQSLQSTPGQSGPVGSASIYMQEVLQLLMTPLTPSQVMTTEDCYRFRIVQVQARVENAKAMLPLIRGALAEYAGSRGAQAPVPQPLDDETTRAQFLELLRGLILIDSAAASQILALKSPDSKLAALIENLTTKLLVPNGNGGQKSFEQVLQLANELTLPFCQVKLSLNLAIEAPTGPEATERLQTQFESLSTAMDNAIEANNVMWIGMLSSLTPDITLHIRTRAESRFLELIPSTKTMILSDEDVRKDIRMAENLLAVIEASLRGATTSKNSISSNLVDKMADLWEIVASNPQETGTLRDAVLLRWLPLMLSYLRLLIAPSTPSAEATRPAAESRARLLLVLAGLTQEFDANPPFGKRALAQQVFDLALVLVDTLPEESRLQCVRAVKDVTSDPKVRYLFSFAANPAESFMLAHREKPPAGLGPNERRALAMGMGLGVAMLPERLSPFVFRRWEVLSEPTPNVGENDTSLSLTLFEARKIK